MSPVCPKAPGSPTNNPVTSRRAILRKNIILRPSLDVSIGSCGVPLHDAGGRRCQGSGRRGRTKLRLQIAVRELLAVRNRPGKIHVERFVRPRGGEDQKTAETEVEVGNQSIENLELRWAPPFDVSVNLCRRPGATGY